MSEAPPTPTNIRRPKALPLDSDTEDISPQDDVQLDSPLPPLVLPSANSLLNFPHPDPSLSGLTPAELYDMNQDLYNDSVPARALIEAVTPMSELRKEYENGTVAFVKQIDWLTDKGYKHVRRTRGEMAIASTDVAHPHPTALGFAYIDSLLSLPPSERDTAVATALSLLDATPSILDSGGIEKLVYEDYYDVFRELVEKVSNGMTAETLLDTFQNAEYSNSVVLYLRLLTSAQIRLNRSNYDGFLVHPDTKEPMDVDSFTANVVQAMGKEADNVEIDALSNALKFNLDLAYLNGAAQDGHVDFIQFRNAPDVNNLPLVLLYRPGHYDILVKGSS